MTYREQDERDHLDTVPRSRYDALNQDWLDAKEKLAAAKASYVVAYEKQSEDLGSVIRDQVHQLMALREAVEQNEQELLTGFMVWMDEHSWMQRLAQRSLTQSIVGADHAKRMWLVAEYLKDRAAEREWGKTG